DLLRQFFTHGGQHKKLSLMEAALDDQHRIGDVFNIISQVEQDVRVNGDERPLALARTHNKAAWLRREVLAAGPRSTYCTWRGVEPPARFPTSSSSQPVCSFSS